MFLEFESIENSLLPRLDVHNVHAASFVQLAHGRTHYYLSGFDKSTKLFLIIHGFTGSLCTLPCGLHEHIAAAGHRVLSYDWYGQGLSASPAMSYNKETLA